MYIVKLDNDFFSGFGEFYRPDHEIFSPELELKVNAVGYFNFTVYPGHSLYDEIDKPKKIISVIRHGENEPLFIGRVSSVEIGFYNEKIITCESELAFLLDSIRVNLYTDPIQYTAEHWLGEILKRHNTNQDRYGSVYSDNIIRKFEAGKISESLSGKTPVTRKDDYQGAFTTLDIIMKLLVNQYGGVLKLRHEDGKNYIDWLDENDLPVCSQKIELGSNILDMERYVQLDGIVTAIRPVGENVGSGDESTPVTLRAYDASPYIENDDIKQTIDSRASANSVLRFYDCLYSESLVEKYGWIQREIKFDGVKEHIALVRKGVKYLLSMGEKSGITITAADLSRADNSIDNFRVGDIAQVNSQIHNINNRKFVVSSLKLDLSDPSKSTLTFGSDMESLTSQMGGTVSYTGNLMIADTTNGNVSASAALKEAKAYADYGLSEKVDKVQGKGLSTNDFSNAYKTKIDGIEEGANKTVVDSAFSPTSTNPVENKIIDQRFNAMVSAAQNETNFLHERINGKVDKIEGKGLSENDFTDTEKNKLENLYNHSETTNVRLSSLEASVNNGLPNKVDKIQGKGLSTNDYTTAEKNKLSGIESGAQKNTITGIKGNSETSYRTGNVNITVANIGAAAYSHEHYYAGSGSIGGAAYSAVKLNTSAGSATQPVYFSDGKPVACTHTLAKSVPADAKFTDTTYSNFVKSGSDAKSGLVPAPSTTAGTTKYLREDGTWTDPNTKWCVGSGAVSSDGWYHFLSKEMNMYEDFNIVLCVTNTYFSNRVGILRINVRRDNTLSFSANSIIWLVRNNFSANDVIGVKTGTKIDYYIKNNIDNYNFIHFNVISQTGRLPSAVCSYTPICSSDPTTGLTATIYSSDSGVVNTANKTAKVTIPRVTKSCNSLPDTDNSVIFEEYTAGTTYNLPNNAFYHIISMKGNDGNYGTQLALGMTNDMAFYRRYYSGTWGNWRSLININTTYSVATASASGLMSASDKTKLDSIGAGTLIAESTTLTDTSATLTITNDLFKTLPFVYVELYCKNRGDNHMSAVLPLKTLITTGKTYYISSCGLDSTVYRCDITCSSAGVITAVFKASTSTTFKITVYKT